ncbi:MAG: hypothetical protein KKD35_02675 [Elusimicrobia bacterium]|nr:hypothetical protein [Elusimicrobiota bacterium]
MEDKTLKSIEAKVEKLANSENMQKYELKRPFDELPDMPFSSYDEMKKAIDDKKASIIINFVNSSGAAFDLAAKGGEKIMFWFSLSATYIITLLMIGLAIFLSNYFLLIAVLWLIVASKFSSYYVNPPLYPFKGRRVADIALVIGVIALLTSESLTVPLLAFSYILMHWSYVLNRRVYGTTLHSRALQSEILFRFLYVPGYIHLSQNEGQKSIFDTR